MANVPRMELYSERRGVGDKWAAVDLVFEVDWQLRSRDVDANTETWRMGTSIRTLKWGSGNEYGVLLFRS